MFEVNPAPSLSVPASPLAEAERREGRTFLVGTLVGAIAGVLGGVVIGMNVRRKR